MKVTQERKLKGTKLVCGANVPGVRKFLDFSLPGSECSTGAKVLYGLFAPGNESAEERKGQIPCMHTLIAVDERVCMSDCASLCAITTTHAANVRYYKFSKMPSWWDG